MQTGGPATAPGWDSGNSRGDTVGDPVAPAVPRQADPRGVSEGMEGQGSQQLPLCSRFASTRQLLGNSIRAAAGKRQNASTRPHPQLRVALVGWHCMAQHGPPPPHGTSIYPTRPQCSDPATSHPRPQNAPTRPSSSVPSAWGSRTRVPSPGCKLRPRGGGFS